MGSGAERMTKDTRKKKKAQKQTDKVNGREKSWNFLVEHVPNQGLGIVARREMDPPGSSNEQGSAQPPRGPPQPTCTHRTEDLAHHMSKLSGYI